MDKTCAQEIQSKMVVMSTTDPKVEEVGTTCDQKDQFKMVVTPTTAKQEKIGTTCHQCRQKIKGLGAHCANKRKGKPCPNKFCHKCLMNRYGEQAEEKSVLKEWNCPKCRGICNCSVCMKRRGQEPTGKLVHTAKANGFASVSELLHSESPKRALVLNKCSKVADEGTEARGTSINEPSDDLLPKPETEKKKKRKLTELNELEEFSMPRGTEMTSIAGINLPSEDVGHALQFLEFCTAFKEVLDLKEGEPISILLELICGENGCRGKQSQVIGFHIVLLSLIHKNFENESGNGSSWLQVLQNCLSKPQNLLEKLKLDGINLEVNEYESLSSSTRLRILTFLCDEALSTETFKRWIDDQNAKFEEKQVLIKERIQEAKQKKKELKLKMQDEVGKAVVANNGAVLSKSEREAIVSEIKIEITKAHAEVMEAENKAADEKRSYEAARTKNLISDTDGHTYWKLKGYADDSNIFLRDVETWDGCIYSERWFTIDLEQAKEVEDRVHSLSGKKMKPRRLKFTCVTKPGAML